MNYQEAKARADVLKALGHPTRILLVEALRHGEKCVMEFRGLADGDSSMLSRHLERLREAGILECRKRGQRVFCRLAGPWVLAALDCAMTVFRVAAKRKGRLLRGA